MSDHPYRWHVLRPEMLRPAAWSAMLTQNVKRCVPQPQLVKAEDWEDFQSDPVGLDRAALSVALYLVDRAYGGPEEGGWYYDCGLLLDADDAFEALPNDWKPTFHNTWRRANKAREALQAKIEAAKLNEGRRSISSVLSDGMYQACIVEGFPHHWPRRRPTYE